MDNCDQNPTTIDVETSTEISEKGATEKEDNMKSAVTFCFTKFRTQLLEIAGAILHNHALAEDVVSQVYIAMLKNISEFKKLDLTGDINIKAYAKIAVRNRAFNMTRDDSRHRELQEVYMDSIPVGFTELSSEEIAISSERAKVLIRHLAELTQAHKEILLLFYNEGLNMSEIAEKLMIDIGTVGSRLNRAKKALKKH